MTLEWNTPGVLRRYRYRSQRYLEGARVQARLMRWDRAADLLWGSLLAALKAVATVRGRTLSSEAEARAFTSYLADEGSEPWLQDPFVQVERLRTSVEEVCDARLALDHLYLIVEDIAAAVERLWHLLPTDEAEPS